MKRMTGVEKYMAVGKDVLDRGGELVISCRYANEAEWVAEKLNDGINSVRQEIFDKLEPYGEHYWLSRKDAEALALANRGAGRTK